MFLQCCALVGSLETWWSVSHDWCVGTEGDKLFMKDRQRRQGGVALYATDQLECRELHLASGDGNTECLWVRGRVGDVTVGGCRRPPAQVEQVDEAPHRYESLLIHAPWSSWGHEAA